MNKSNHFLYFLVIILVIIFMYCSMMYSVLLMFMVVGRLVFRLSFLLLRMHLLVMINHDNYYSKRFLTSYFVV